MQHLIKKENANKNIYLLKGRVPSESKLENVRTWLYTAQWKALKMTLGLRNLSFGRKKLFKFINSSNM